MERKNAKNITIDILLNNENKDFFADTFEKYLNLGYNDENIPISPLYFSNVNERNNRIFIEEDVYFKLKQIEKLTIEKNKEIPFCLLGYEQSNGSIIFYNIIQDTTNLSQTETNFENIARNLEFFLEYADKSKGLPIICKGHSHSKGHLSDNFSFGDLISLVSFKQNIKEYTNSVNKNNLTKNDIDVVSMLINPNGDFNFIYYEDRPGQTNFYKFTNIFYKTKDNILYLLPSLNENGNYVKKHYPTR